MAGDALTDHLLNPLLDTHSLSQLDLCCPVWSSALYLLFRLMQSFNPKTNTHSYKNTHTMPRMGTGLFLEADSLGFNTTIKGWKKEGRKRRKGEEEMSRVMREHL